MSDREHPWQIAVCETGGIASKTIQGVTRGKYTHSYLIVGDDVSRLSSTVKPGTYSMEPDGLTWRPYDYWGDHNPTSQFATTFEQRGQITSFLIAHRRVMYDFVGDVIVGIDDLTPSWMDPFWHVVEHVEDVISPAWFCSAFTDAAFTSAGIVVIRGRSKIAEHGVTPMDLYRDWVDRGWYELAA